jgi:hypothetical protein
MPGLVPGIHVVAPMYQPEIENSGRRNDLAPFGFAPRPGVDGRDKPGHDGERSNRFLSSRLGIKARLTGDPLRLVAC